MKKKHIIGLSITLVVLLGTGLWVKSRYNVWFGNPEEPAYSPLEMPGRVLLTFGEDESSRNISWQCDSVVVPSHVLLVDTLQKDTITIPADGEVFQSRSGKMTYYVARLRSLKPDRTYSYQVHNGTKSSDWYNFRTHNQDTSNNYSFLFMGDVQDTLHGKTNQYLREALHRHKDTEFLLFGGDIIERPMDKYWGELFNGLDSIAQYYPVLNVTGNHDYLKHVICKLERRFSLVFSNYLDSQVGENQVYTLKYNDLQLFLLDSNRELPYLLKQRKWLKKELQQSKARWKVVVLHHPLYSIRGKSNNLIQKLVFNPLIEEYNVDLVLQGHEHAYARRTTHGKAGEITTPVYTVSHCSPKNYHIQFDESFDRFGISSRYYQRIHIHQDTLTMVTYDVNTQEVYDSLDIVKQPKPAVLDYGKNIPEYLEYAPKRQNKKNLKFQQRIDEYKKRTHQM